ncbi:diaminopimelate epimerase [Streptomyces chrestomyceticus]|uniref:diaminopimelate epimerase n=1 Tax=Streptomyces chrestomyceticus TaxID=68185 RepID=UPI003679654F
MGDFVKYQALGNDYLIVDPRGGSTALGTEPAPGAVRLLCDRHLGAGADGLLFGPLDAPRPGTAAALRIFNADGSECGMSGNGLRMFALYLGEHYVREWRTGTPFTVRTPRGEAEVRITDITDGRVSVDMGRARFATDGGTDDGGAATTVVPLAGTGPDSEVTVTDLHLGVPHTVVLRDTIDGELVRRLGPALAWHPRHPEGTNVEFVRVHDGRTLDIAVWERAAGAVPASGSGACAAAAVAHVRGLVGPDVTVRMPGGEVEVNVAGDGRISSVGTAREVMTGVLSRSLLKELAQWGSTSDEPSGRRGA